jgi:ribosomal biogenesis protein LAS1
MSLGRVVPWVEWEEWSDVRRWLFSERADEAYRGINRVEAWRIRGKIPLGIDITASLVEIGLRCGSLCIAELHRC